MIYFEWKKAFVEGGDKPGLVETGVRGARTSTRKNGGEGLTNGESRGIIKSGSDVVALEEQRYGRNKNTLVDKSYIESGEYRRKFDKLTDNPDVNKTLYDCAKTALKHRSGTELEDMYWIDADTGIILTKEINNIVSRQVTYSKATRKVLLSDVNILAIHSHPGSMPPSIDDFNACYRHGYKNGYVVCHDGKVFGYSSHEPVSERLYSLYVESGLKSGLSEYEAQIAALNELKRSYSIDFWEAK